MRRQSSWIGVLLVAGLLIGGAAPVRAVSPVSFEDPAGDQLDLRPSMDILKVSWDVKRTSKVGRPWMVVEMTLAAAPEERLVSYFAEGDAGSDCFVEASYRPGNVFAEADINSDAWFIAGCNRDGDEMAQIVDARLEIKGNVITVSAPLDAITKAIRDSGQLTALSATAEIAEPMTGILGTTWLGAPGADNATTDQTFRYA